MIQIDRKESDRKKPGDGASPREREIRGSIRLSHSILYTVDYTVTHTRVIYIYI